jgi:hypothetical protein
VLRPTFALRRALARRLREHGASPPALFVYAFDLIERDRADLLASTAMAPSALAER